MPKNKICYWSVGWGNHSYMMQALVDSFNKFEIDGDFIAFSDIQIKGAVNKGLESSIDLNTSDYLFKFNYLINIIIIIIIFINMM